MDSSRTVADMRTAFARFQYAPAEFLRKLNAGCAHFLGSDVYTDIFSIIDVVTSSGYFAMPRQFGRAYGIVQDGLPLPILSQWTPFVSYGLARFNVAQFAMGAMRDLGNRFCTQDEVWTNGTETPGTIRITITNAADANKIIRLDGTSDGATRVFDAAGNLGLNVTTASMTQDTTQIFQTLDGVQAPLMLYPWTIGKVISGVHTVIGRYEPGETRPRYTRYQVGPNSGTIRVIAKMKHVQLVADTDWVYPDNLVGHEKAFDAQSYSDRGDFKTEAEAWEIAKTYLKEYYAATVPYVETFMSSDNFGGPLRPGGMQVGGVNVGW